MRPEIRFRQRMALVATGESERGDERGGDIEIS
jgi:hypothetical protein